MYRDKLVEFKQEKGISTKQWSVESGVSVDTIHRIIHPEHLDKDSPKVNTLEDLCKPLGRDLWELFYTGNTSLVSLQAEIASLSFPIVTPSIVGYMSAPEFSLSK